MRQLLDATGTAKVLFLLSTVAALIVVLATPAEWIAFALRFMIAVGLVMLVQHYYGAQLKEDPLFFFKKPTTIGASDGVEPSTPTEGGVEERGEERGSIPTA